MIGVESVLHPEIQEVMERYPEIYEILKYCPYEVLREWEFYQYEQGTLICQQGEVQERLFIVVEGLLDIYILAENGRKYTQAVYRQGDIVGELEIFEGKPFVSNVEALTKIKLIGLPRDLFLKWIELDHHFTLYLLRKVTRLFYDLSQKAGEDKLYSLYHRICRHLLSHVEGRRQNGEEIRVVMDKQKLSQQLAVTPRSINRVLQKLKQKGILELDSHTLRVKDIEKLRKEEKLSKYD